MINLDKFCQKVMATLSKLALNNKVRKLASRQTQMETAKLVVARDDAKANLVTLTVTTAPPQCFQNLPRRKRDRIVGQKYIYNTLVCIWNGKRVFCDGELILRIGKEMRDIALHRKL